MRFFVIYVTGHGYLGPSGLHVLVMPAGADDRVARDGYPTLELLMAALHSDAQHILVIVNTCFAGGIAEDLIGRLRDLPSDRRDLRTVAVVCTADFNERPRVREFSTLMSRVYDQLRGSVARAAHRRPRHRPRPIPLTPSTNRTRH